MEFWICRKEKGPQWMVRRDGQIYGDYLDRQQALLDAVEAAKDAFETGQDVQVWDSSTNARVF